MTEDLKKELGKLNLNIQSKIELWLVYRDSKPAAFISIKLDDDQSYHSISKDIKLLKQWLNKAGLFVLQDESQPESFYVSKDETVVKKLSKIMWKDDKKSVYKKGILFGYPEKAVKRYSNNIELLNQSLANFEQVGLICGDDFSSYNIYPWSPYIRYIARKKELDEDS